MFVKEETSQIEQRVKGKYKDVEARHTSLHNEIFRSLGPINSCFNLNASKTILEI